MRSIAFVALIVLVYGLLAFGLNLPQDVGLDVPDGKLNSLSFAPYREGQGPLEEVFPSAAEVEADIKLLAEKTHTIRTYASAEGVMPLIPALARKYGVDMLQGAWLGGDKAVNAKEIAELIRSANANPDVVKRVIVGNEVLLRGDLTAEDLMAYIRQVQQAVKQPVSYADVWSEYMKHPQLVQEVDFVTIHILPYWEDEPIAVDAAPAHIAKIYKQVQQEAYRRVPNIPILIGESGWPSAGRQRGHAVPGVVNEAKFIRALIKVANDNGFDYNIVEAFNQSWKSALEGVVGANWGMYSVDREEVFPLTGKVYENPEWLQQTLIAIGLFLAVFSVAFKPLQSLPAARQLGWLILAQVLILLVVQQADFLWYTSYSPWQRLQTSVLVALNIGLGALVLLRSFKLLAEQPFKAQWGQWLYYLLLVFAALAIYRTLGLGINGRYISFPSIAAAVPVVGSLALVLLNYLLLKSKSWAMVEVSALTGSPQVNHKRNKLLADLLLAAGILLPLGESEAFVVSRDFIQAYPELGERLLVAVGYTFANTQLVTWLACVAVLALPLWLSGRSKA